MLLHRAPLGGSGREFVLEVVRKHLAERAPRSRARGRIRRFESDMPSQAVRSLWAVREGPSTDRPELENDRDPSRTLADRSCCCTLWFHVWMASGGSDESQPRLTGTWWHPGNAR